MTEWNYLAGIEVSKEHFDALPENKRQKVGDKYFLVLGRTFNTGIRASVGDVIRVSILEIQVKPIEGTKFKEYAWMTPKVLETVPEKSISDKVETLDRLAGMTRPQTTKHIPLSILEAVEEISRKLPKEIRDTAKEGEPYPDEYYHDLKYEEGEMPRRRSKDSDWRFVLQHHWSPEAHYKEASLREKFAAHVQALQHDQGFFEKDQVDIILKLSNHHDLRFELPKYLKGWSLFADPEKLKAMFRGDQHIQCTVKPAQIPKEWLTEAGEFEPGEPGGGVHQTGQMEIVDKGTLKFGVQRKDLHEYFFDGREGKIKGRWVFRALKIRGSAQWHAWSPQDQKPMDPVEHEDEGYVSLLKEGEAVKYSKMAKDDLSLALSLLSKGMIRSLEEIELEGLMKQAERAPVDVAIAKLARLRREAAERAKAGENPESIRSDVIAQAKEIIAAPFDALKTSVKEYLARRLKVDPADLNDLPPERQKFLDWARQKTLEDFEAIVRDTLSEAHESGA